MAGLVHGHVPMPVASTAEELCRTAVRRSSFTVDVADNSYSKEARFRKFREKPDRSIRCIADFFRRHTREIDKNTLFVNLQAICSAENPNKTTSTFSNLKRRERFQFLERSRFTNAKLALWVL